MKRLVFAALVALVFGFSTLAHATLTNVGTSLIYDTGNGITWYDYTLPLGTLANANTWASTRTVPGTAAGTTWTLPTLTQLEELRTELGGSFSPFNNLGTIPYWSSTPVPSTSYHYAYYLGSGTITEGSSASNYDAVVVATGNVATVPVPGAILLFAPGLLGLMVVRKRFKK